MRHPGSGTWGAAGRRPLWRLSLVSMYDRVEFSLLAGALVSVQHTFHLSDASAGWLSSGAGIASVVLLLPAGRLSDRVNRVRAVTAVIGVWTLLTLATGLASSFAMLLVIRIVIGGASLLYNPAVSSLLTDYYPPESRSRAFGVERLMYFVGNPVGIIVGGVLAQTVGWRWAFIGLVVPGLLVAVLTSRLREPIRGSAERATSSPSYPAAPTAMTFAAPPPADLTTPTWRQLVGLLHGRLLRTICCALLVLFTALGGIFFWMPTYYHRAFHLPLGAAAGMSGGVGLIGMLIGTYLGSRLGDRGHANPARSRISLGAAGLTLGLVGLGGGLAGGLLPFELVGFLVANAGFGVAIPNLTAATADLVAVSDRGLAFALLQVVVGAGSSIGPVLIGVSSDGLGGLRVGFAVLLIPLAAAVTLTYRAAVARAQLGRAVNPSVAG